MVTKKYYFIRWEEVKKGGGSWFEVYCGVKLDFPWEMAVEISWGEGENVVEGGAC